MNPRLRELQLAFVAAVYRGDTAALEPLVRARGLPPAARLAVYRNDTVLNLSGALAAAYPVVQRLVGEGFFAFAAGRYVEAQPSTSGDLHGYGAGFAAWLEALPQTESLAYLAEVARLEWALHEAYFAAEAPPLVLDALARLPVQAHARLRVRLHPSARLLASSLPVLAIWQANQPGADGGGVDLGAGVERLLVSRLAGEVGVARLGVGEFALLAALADGAALARACAEALEAEPGFDPGPALGIWLARGLAVDAYFVNNDEED